MDAEARALQAAPRSLRLNPLPLFSEAFDEPVYLGVIANTERQTACLAYLQYLLQTENNLSP